MSNNSHYGEHCVIAESAQLGTNITIGHNCIIEDNVVIGDNTYIDNNSIIRRDVNIGANSFIGAGCIIGEYWMDFCLDRKPHTHPLVIGEKALIRSGSVIYAGSSIGNNFQTGHHVNIREKSQIGNNVSIGTFSIIDGCKIGDFVRIHNNVAIPRMAVVDNYVWIFPNVLLTNDPTPPSKEFLGTHINSFAVIASGTVILPGVEVGQDCLIGVGAIVTKSVEPYAVAVGNPAKKVSDVREVKNKITGEPAYPWRKHFGKYMPWEEMGFDAWYASLDLEDKTKYALTHLSFD